MDRRHLDKHLGSGAFLGVPEGGHYWRNASAAESSQGVDLMLDRLDVLAKSPIETTGSWGAVRTFNHLSQSVEFSMAGFPKPKPVLFQRTVGKLAYRVFRARGAMRHGLDQVIPGEVVDEAGETQDAIRRLKSALLAFKGHDADLKPHFAYGALTKDEYAIAHILHINNHLEEFRLV